jgi:dienelactone hydrolase
MTRALRAACVIVVLAWAQSAVADPSLKDLAARTELRAIETLTLTDQQFLTGDKSGKAVTIAGELRFPQGAAAGRLPAVILQHGSGGATSGHELWAKTFNEMGIASFLVDSFSGRGIVRTSTDQALLGRLNMVLDGYRAFEVLANHARIDPARIAVMGFSRGGQAALYASLNRFRQSWNKSGAEFTAYIPFYPDCMTTFVSDTEVADRSIRIFHGAADDYNPAAPCKAYAERLRAAGRDVQLTEYPDAHHGYDNPLGNKTPSVAKGSQSVRACKLKEEPLGTIINAETGQPFT